MFIREGHILPAIQVTVTIAGRGNIEVTGKCWARAASGVFAGTKAHVDKMYLCKIKYNLRNHRREACRHSCTAQTLTRLGGNSIQI